MFCSYWRNRQMHLPYSLFLTCSPGAFVSLSDTQFLSFTVHSLNFTCFFPVALSTSPHQNITQFFFPRFESIQRGRSGFCGRGLAEGLGRYLTIKYLPHCSSDSSLPHLLAILFELHGIGLLSWCWIFPGFCYFYFTELDVGRGNYCSSFIPPS